jgi:hypothetical protein
MMLEVIWKPPNLLSNGAAGARRRGVGKRRRAAAHFV